MGEVIENRESNLQKARNWIIRQDKLVDEQHLAPSSIYCSLSLRQESINYSAYSSDVLRKFLRGIFNS